MNWPGNASTTQCTCPNPSRRVIRADPLSTMNMPGLGFPVSNNNAPAGHFFVSPKWETRRISSSVKTGYIWCLRLCKGEKGASLDARGSGGASLGASAPPSSSKCSILDGMDGEPAPFSLAGVDWAPAISTLVFFILSLQGGFQTITRPPAGARLAVAPGQAPPAAGKANRPFCARKQQSRPKGRLCCFLLDAPTAFAPIQRHAGSATLLNSRGSLSIRLVALGVCGFIAKGLRACGCLLVGGVGRGQLAVQSDLSRFGQAADKRNALFCRALALLLRAQRRGGGLFLQRLAADDRDGCHRLPLVELQHTHASRRTRCRPNVFAANPDHDARVGDGQSFFALAHRGHRDQGPRLFAQAHGANALRQAAGFPEGRGRRALAKAFLADRQDAQVHFVVGDRGQDLDAFRHPDRPGSASRPGQLANRRFIQSRSLAFGGEDQDFALAVGQDGGGELVALVQVNCVQA